MAQPRLDGILDINPNIAIMLIRTATGAVGLIHITTSGIMESALPNQYSLFLPNHLVSMGSNGIDTIPANRIADATFGTRSSRPKTYLK